ncbi:MAG: valine--tRNA ligase [Rhodospirillales bacterium]|nr:valine--tRNA ligase [Rhodospirillales bacterium]
MTQPRNDEAADGGFAKTYSPADIETRRYAEWEKAGAFACNPDASAQPYTIMMPPPNVTGSLHMGHALTFTVQDVLIRHWRMRGRDALWQPGTDHAGIATQMVVERRLAEQGVFLDRGGVPPKNANAKLIGRAQFLEEAWKWKAESGGTITRQLRRLGASPDWARERFTMDEGLSRAVRRVFVDLFRQGLIYRDKRLVNWDPKLQTAVSDLEVEQREIKGNLWHFRYPIEGDPSRFIVVATTRPETMLGDTAVAVHPDDSRFKELVGKRAVLPLVGRAIPIVADEYSDPEKGSGAVKITPAHDFNDFEVGRRHGLAMINVLDRDARIAGDVPEKYRGLDRHEARKLVVADIEAAGLLEKVEAHTHMVPHGDRSGVALEPWLTDQWFCDAATLARPAIEAVENGHTRFVPKHWENTYYEWMRNIQPWCISRQLWWGHRIPAWYGPDGEVFVAHDVQEAQSAARSKYGRDVELVQDNDVLDTWFSSALWPFSTLGWPEPTPELKRYYPGDVLVTGFDIIFFWVARMMMMGIHFGNPGKPLAQRVPFRTVYIHALVRDERGQKMSKSKGNIIDPLDIIGKYGTDALRFTLCALAAQGRDIKLAPARVEGYRNFITKLWNAARYARMNGAAPVADFDPTKVSGTVNKWLLGELARAAAGVTAAIEGYRFNEAADAIYRFVWGTFCDWYLEFTKPLLQQGSGEEKSEVRATAAYTIGICLKLLHPLAPYVTEELWEVLGYRKGDLPLMSESWPVLPAEIGNAAAEEEMNWVVDVITAIRALRAEMNVPQSAKLPLYRRDAGTVAQARLGRHEGLIRTLARVEAISAEPVGQGTKGAAPIAVADATLVLPLAGFIDTAAESKRIEKEIARLAGDAEKLSRKLANADFLAKADPEVVEEQRERLAETDAARQRLSASLRLLQGL